MNNFALFGVSPVLLTALAVASCHLHLMRKIVSNPRTEKDYQTRSSWFNCALRDDEALYWVIIGHYEAVEVGN